MLLSDNTISHLIKDLYENIEFQIMSHLKEVNMLAIQLYESTDINVKP